MSPIDTGIIIIFLGLTLWIGIRVSREIKTFREYAVGNRSFSSFAIFCTLIASFIDYNFSIGKWQVRFFIINQTI